MLSLILLFPRVPYIPSTVPVLPLGCVPAIVFVFGFFLTSATEIVTTLSSMERLVVETAREMAAPCSYEVVERKLLRERVKATPEMNSRKMEKRRRGSRVRFMIYILNNNLITIMA